MFDGIGWSEMMVVGVVALIVVGPKDLPKMFHAVGQFTGKARGMAREFQSAMNAAAKEAGVDDMARDLRKAASGQSLKEATGFDEIDKEFRDIGRIQPDVRKTDKPSDKSANPAKGDPGADASGDEFAFEDEADEAEVAAHDADIAKRNAEMSATEAERLKKAERSAAARQKAAQIRAEREAEVAQARARAAEDPQPWTPDARGSEAAQTDPAAPARDDASESKT